MTSRRLWSGENMSRMQNLARKSFEKFPAVFHKDGLLFRDVEISGSTTIVVKLVQINPN